MLTSLQSKTLDDSEVAIDAGRSMRSGFRFTSEPLSGAVAPFACHVLSIGVNQRMGKVR